MIEKRKGQRRREREKQKIVSISLHLDEFNLYLLEYHQQKRNYSNKIQGEIQNIEETKSVRKQLATSTTISMDTRWDQKGKT